MRYTLGIIFIIILVVLATVFAVGRNRTPRGVGLPKTVHTADYATNESSSVRWTHEGRLLGSDERRSVRITISPDKRVAEVIQGYNGNIIKSMELPNDMAAYSTFMLALENMNFGKERVSKLTDERSACPLGHRFIYELYEGSSQKLRLWSTSCHSNEGNYSGIAPSTRQLFKNQITGYEKFVTGVKF